MSQKPSAGAKPQRKKGISWFFQIGSIDVIFCCAVLMLFAVGIVMMYSASYAYAAANSTGPEAFFKKQLFLGIVGIFLMFFISHLDYRTLNSWLTPYIIAPVSLALVFAAIVQNWGSDFKRWLYIVGSTGFQPSEVAKFAMILLLSYMLCILTDTLRAGPNQSVRPKLARITRPERLLYKQCDGRMKATVAVAAVISVFTAAVLLGDHLSGAVLIFCTGVAMMWLGGVPKKYFAILFALAAVPIAVIVIKPTILLDLGIDGFRIKRLLAWRKISLEGFNLTDARWQTDQGLVAIGSGGIFGLGLGNSKQKLLWVPEPQNDFIFTIVCEELGFIGALAIIALFAVLIIRGFMISVKTSDYFGSLVVCGIMMQIAIQVLFNIAVVTDCFPNTGIPLPFFSYGGTSLLILLMEMGVVLSVSRRSYIDKK